MKSLLREPVVAGSFYEGNQKALQKLLAGFPRAEKQENALACIMPHAGYMYSGKTAFRTASSVMLKKTIILLGPNHTGLGNFFSVSSRPWKTPLGTVEIDYQFIEQLKKECDLISGDESAHMREHSLEVELPILQFLNQQEFFIVPLCLMQTNPDYYKRLAEGIAATIKTLNIAENVLLVASSDMNHFESQQIAKKKDNLAIEAILNLDEDLLLERVQKYDISMCGAVPAAITLKTAKLLGAHKARLVEYCTSGDVTGDHESVVGYAGFVITA